MACSSRLGTACFVEFLNEEYGERITGRDWHGIRVLTEVEHGQRLTRTRARAQDTNRIVSNIESLLTPDAEGLGRLRAALDTETPTEGTLRAVDYLTRHGVKETLAKVRGESKPAARADLYAFTVTDNGATYVQTVDNAALLGRALHDKPAGTYTVSETRDGVVTEMDASSADALVREGWREHQEQSKVVPDSVIYAVSVESEGRNYNYHSTDAAKIRDIIRQFPYGSKATVYEERQGSTVGNPNNMTYENVELTARELEAFMAEPDED